MRQPSRVVSSAPVPSLARWGVSADADLMYRSLLAFGAQPAGRLERDLGMPRHRVAHGLDELASVQAVTARPGPGRRGVVWAPKAPTEVVTSLHQRRRASHRVRVPDWQESLRRILPGSVPLDDGLRHLPSRALTRARLKELIGVVRHEHLAMQPEPAYDPESARSALPMDRTLLSRGVRMRVLGTQSAGGDPLAVHGRQPDEPRPDYRETDDIPMKLIVMDRSVALFPVTPDNLDSGYLEVTQERVVSALARLFEQHWTAAGIVQESIMREISLTLREQALVRLLAQGHTDATAARELRISPRSVSSTLRHLMDRLGVNNRFQLGLALGTLRVLPPPTESEPPSTMEEPA